MPFFKSTYNILKKQDEDEVFDENWMNYDGVYLPPKTNWDYKKELQIEDVQIWEVIYEQGGGTGVYASWDPYAEFYMVVISGEIKTFYGTNIEKEVMRYLDLKKIPYPKNKKWVDCI
jgi:hypothetical protein